jgi:phosphatidylglycerol:prolipoprotein diacylglycerol transferase
VHPVLFHIGSLLIPSYGAFSALGVLVALFLAQRTARMAGVNTTQVWNLSVIALFAALAGQRLLLIAINFTDLRSHPRWMLGLAMIHHPLLSAAGALAGLIAAVVYARAKRMPAARTADALAAPLALGLACEQLGALMAGSGFGTETTVRWAVTYTNVLAGLWLLGAGVAVYVTEIWRDTEGRGSLLRGAMDGPQVAAIFFVLAGGLVLRERKVPVHESEMNHG